MTVRGLPEFSMRRADDTDFGLIWFIVHQGVIIPITMNQSCVSYEIICGSFYFSKAFGASRPLQVATWVLPARAMIRTDYANLGRRVDIIDHRVIISIPMHSLCIGNELFSGFFSRHSTKLRKNSRQDGYVRWFQSFLGWWNKNGSSVWGTVSVYLLISFMDDGNLGDPLSGWGINFGSPSCALDVVSLGSLKLR